jgi:hypothetical protein
MVKLSALASEGISCYIVNALSTCRVRGKGSYQPASLPKYESRLGGSGATRPPFRILAISIVDNAY